MKKIGYTTGVFDMFHVGHLNVLKRAKLECDYLIVGVTSDELSMKAKNKHSHDSFESRHYFHHASLLLAQPLQAGKIVRKSDGFTCI